MNRRVATIGFFDGVHLGHLCLIRQLKEVAQDVGAESIIVTMWPHPRFVLQPESCPELLTTLDEKLNLLRQSGVDRVEVLPFDLSMSRLHARDFMKNVLCARFGINRLLMGYDHQFGHGGGTIMQYAQWGKDVGIETIHAAPLAEEHVSSSTIRQLLKEGRVEKASALLGRPYELGGMVVDGFKVGRKLGFPTANILPQDAKLVPAKGVYAVWVVLPDGARYKGMLNIGNRPTLDNGTQVSIEVYVLDFKGDLYHQTLQLIFITKLRDEIRFHSLDDLKMQLCRDVLAVNRLLG